MTPIELLARARRCLASAVLLSAAGDPSGACNRTSYGMFDAARAALFALDPGLNTHSIKTHSGLVSAFSLNLAKPGHIPLEYGKSLRQVDQIRLIADYSDQDIDPDTSAAAIRQAGQFIDAVDRYLAGVA